MTQAPEPDEPDGPDARWREHADRSRELLEAANGLIRAARGAPLLVSDDAPTGVVVPVLPLARLFDVCERIERAGELTAGLKQL